MKTSSLSKALYAPLLIGAILCLYFIWEYSTEYAIYLVPFVVGFAVVFIMSPQIDWWWWQRYPPKLSAPLVELMRRKLPFFEQLSPDERTRFANRVAMYMRGVEFSTPKLDPIPVDIQAVLAMAAVRVTFGKEDFLLPPFEKVILYPHPFPSPVYPDQWHTSELYLEDGVLLFSMEQIAASFADPKTHFHLPYYEYCRAFQHNYPNLKFPSWDAQQDFHLSGNTNFTFPSIQNWIGLKPEFINTSAVLMALCLQQPDAMKKEHPAVYRQVSDALGYAI